MPQDKKKPERQSTVRVFTFSYRRLNYVCATINLLKAQTHDGFTHHLHLLGYTKEQGEFVRQVANGDKRFVISELENLSQRENLMRILAEMPLDADSYIRMDDDDVYLPTYLEEMHKASLEAGSDLTAFTTLLRHNQRTASSHLVRESGIYGMTMCLSRKAVEYLLSRPNWEHPGYEDSWIDKSLELAGYKRHITQTERPLVLYVQHATNVSCADREEATDGNEAKMPPIATVSPTQTRAIPEGSPDCVIPMKDHHWEGRIGFYEAGVFVLEATGAAGNWDVTDDGNLVLEFWGSGRKAVFSNNEAMAKTGQNAAPTRTTAVQPSIPRIIHQTWKTREIDLPFREEWCASWREKNPGWDYRFWTDDDLEVFVRKEYPEFLPTYLGYDVQIKRVDAARYLILKRFGGVYADMDFICLKPLAPLLDGRSLVFASQYEDVSAHQNDWVCNAWMASIPGHPFWNGIEMAMEGKKNMTVLDATGPVMLSKWALKCRETLADENQPIILPSALIYPVEWHESGKSQRLRAMAPVDVAREFPYAYAMTVWTASWWGPR